MTVENAARGADQRGAALRLDLVGARVAPHVVQEVFAGQHAPRRFEKRLQEVEFLGRELDFRAGAADEFFATLPAAEIEALQKTPPSVDVDQLYVLNQGADRDTALGAAQPVVEGEQVRRDRLHGRPAVGRHRLQPPGPAISGGQA